MYLENWNIFKTLKNIKCKDLIIAGSEMFLLFNFRSRELEG